MDTESTRPERLQIAITGSSGLVGTKLTEYLGAENHDLIRLVRGEAESEKGEVSWRPSHGEIDAVGLDGIDAVVHLAGESIFGRWTRTKKQAILESRRQGTQLISRTLAGLHAPPRVFVSASAVGYYGDTGDRLVNESDAPGEGFLAEVCQRWEAATRAASEAGIRTVRLRIGVVLSSQGGALRLMRVPFQLGLGGRVGSGNQYMSWIHIRDLVRVIESVILDESLEGPVNAVAPHPVTNRQFTGTLAAILHRPAVCWVPGAVARIALGQMAAEVLLVGQRVEPRKLADRQFEFEYAELDRALRRELV